MKQDKYFGKCKNFLANHVHTCLRPQNIYIAMEALQEDQEGGDNGLLALWPLTEYRRMLSWQLSQLQPAPVTSTRRAQKERERRKNARVTPRWTTFGPARTRGHSVGEGGHRRTWRWRFCGQQRWRRGMLLFRTRIATCL